MRTELLTRLNPASAKTEYSPSGRPEIDREAVLFALSGLHRAQLGLAFVLSGEDREKHQVWAGLINKSLYSRHYRSKAHKARVESLCHLAIEEFTTRPICKLCNGAKVIAAQGYKICNSCAGTGLKPYSDSKRARYIGRHHSNWATYRDLYGYLMEVLQSWQDEIDKRLNKRIQ